MDDTGKLFVLTSNDVSRVAFRWDEGRARVAGEYALCVAHEAVTTHCLPVTWHPDGRLTAYPSGRFQVYGRLLERVAKARLSPADFEALKRGDTIGEEPGPSIEQRLAALEEQMAQLEMERKEGESHG